jgi:hypothetical protein
MEASTRPIVITPRPQAGNTANCWRGTMICFLIYVLAARIADSSSRKAVSFSFAQRNAFRRPDAHRQRRLKNLSGEQTNC